MQQAFTKMHGLGNDFMVVDATRTPFQPSAARIQQWGDRHRGIGFDQLLVIDPATDPRTDFACRIYNCDGSAVQQCGNGMRCVARYVADKQLSDQSRLCLQTAGALVETQLLDKGQVQITMGQPILTPAAIPLRVAEQAPLYSLDIDGQRIEVGAVSLGNPHMVYTVDDIHNAPVAQWGPLLATHSAFPEGANVGFMQVIDAHRIKLCVFERGAGETQACGSGACAAVVVGRLNQQLAEEVQVELPGGTLQIAWQGEGHAVSMTGPTATVFEGVVV